MNDLHASDPFENNFQRGFKFEEGIRRRWICVDYESLAALTIVTF